MADYIVFTGKDKRFTEYGEINNVKDIEEAKRKIQGNPYLKNKVFFLINKKNITRVET